VGLEAPTKELDCSKLENAFLKAATTNRGFLIYLALLRLFNDYEMFPTLLKVSDDFPARFAEPILRLGKIMRGISPNGNNLNHAHRASMGPITRGFSHFSIQIRTAPKSEGASRKPLTEISPSALPLRRTRRIISCGGATNGHR
jgi:hypothetical protein